MSNMDLIPAQNTATGVRESSMRSADISKVTSDPKRCTPPTPPVAKNFMPARLERRMVLATVVAAEDFRAQASGMSLVLAFKTLVPEAKISKSFSSRPTFGIPSIIATVAGIAPESRTVFSMSLATSKFFGYGMPCEMIVLSKATTGIPSLKASFTSAEMDINEDNRMDHL